MVFTTHIFLFVFLPLVTALYFAMPGRGKNILLTAASFVFYGWWRPDFVLLMLFSAFVDYHAGGRVARIEDDRKKRLWVLASCVVNLSLLSWFKYADFGIESLNAIFARFGAEPWPLLHVVLPVGISFYTFQSMSYTIDIYRGDAEPQNDIIDFMAYVALFPQLVAGPIVRYREIAEQLRSRKHSLQLASTGALLFQMGFAKKVLLADTLAPLADRAFSLGDPSTPEAWLGIVAYAFQIYFDFSGYSDMAMGLGLVFGFVFPMNFNSPYKSQSITDFWRRWHVSLSSWLRDYLYIPMGGNRRGPKMTYVFLMLTMLLGGLWHGASWTFVAWGAYQGGWLVIERLIGRKPFYAALPKPLRIAITFVIALGGWVFFRAVSIGQALAYLGAMFGSSGESGLRFEIDRATMIAFAAGSLVIWGTRPAHEQVQTTRPWLGATTAVFFLVAVCETYFQSYRPFLYFQF